MGDVGASHVLIRYRVTRWVSFVVCNPLRFIDPFGHTPGPQPLIDGLYSKDYATDHANDIGETPLGQEPDAFGVGSYKTSKGMIDYIESRRRSKKMVLDGLTGAILIVDGTAMVISYAEQIFVDGVAAILLLGCFGGPEMCGPAVALVVQVDLTTTAVAGIVENPLGGISLGLTFVSDVIQGNNTLSSIGVDTLVSARNAFLGFIIPEANIDSWISQSQFGYDLDRLSGAEPGGAIPFSDTGQILLQLIWYDTFWEEAFGNIFPQ